LRDSKGSEKRGERAPEKRRRMGGIIAHSQKKKISAAFEKILARKNKQKKFAFKVSGIKSRSQPQKNVSLKL